MEILLISLLFILASFFFIKRFIDSFSATKKSSCPGCDGGCQVSQIEETFKEVTGKN